MFDQELTAILLHLLALLTTSRLSALLFTRNWTLSSCSSGCFIRPFDKACFVSVIVTSTGRFDPRLYSSPAVATTETPLYNTGDGTYGAALKRTWICSLMPASLPTPALAYLGARPPHFVPCRGQRRGGLGRLSLLVHFQRCRV